MSDPVLDADAIACLTSLAGVLVPAAGKMPSAGTLPGFDNLLQSAVKASGLSAAEVNDLIGILPAGIDWRGARALAAAEPSKFEMLAQLVTGAYLMAPEVLKQLGFPTERRFPAGAMEFADEYETGIVDPVVARGQRFRDPRTKT